MWTITKQFDFCYGHRVWSQSLNAKFSLDNCLKCRHLHGHGGIINISLQADVLKDGMVTDFKHTNFFKKWLDDVLDHKFIMDREDPLLKFEVPVLFDSEGYLDLSRLNFHEEGYYTIKEEFYKHHEQCLQEKYEGMVIVNFVPTSENLSQWVYTIVQEKMNELGVKVSGVQFFETPKSQSIYSI